MRNINISNIRAKNVTASAGYIYGIPEQPVEGLTVSNYSVDMIDTEGELKDKPIMAFHVRKTKGEGIFCTNIRNSVFRDIAIKVVHGSGIEFENASNVSVYGLHTYGTDKPSVIKNSKNIQFND
jgi:hypothetical protein